MVRSIREQFHAEYSKASAPGSHKKHAPSGLPLFRPNYIKPIRLSFLFRGQVLRVYADLTTQLQETARNQVGGGGGGSGASTIADGDENREGVPRKRPRILHPGCGSSTLGVVLKREHGCDVVNADFSEVLVLCGSRGERGNRVAELRASTAVFRGRSLFTVQ